MHVVSAFGDVPFPVLLLVYSIIIGQYLMGLISVRYQQFFAYDNNIWSAEHWIFTIIFWIVRIGSTLFGQHFVQTFAVTTILATSMWSSTGWQIVNLATTTYKYALVNVGKADILRCWVYFLQEYMHLMVPAFQLPTSNCIQCKELRIRYSIFECSCIAEILHSVLLKTCSKFA